MHMQTCLHVILLAGLACLAGSAGEGQQPEPKTDAKRKPKFTISKATTYVTKPVDKDGYIDYVAAMNEWLKKGLTPEKNAVVLLMKALGPRVNEKEMRSAKFFALLGLEPPPDDGDYCRPAAVYLKKEFNLDLNRIFKQWEHLTDRPWAANEFPHFAAWLKANDKPLALVIEAAKREQYFLPIVATKGEKVFVAALPVADLIQLRELASVLTIRANLRIREKRYDEAWLDLLTCYRLGGLAARGGTWLEALNGIFFYHAASVGNVALLTAAEVDTKRIKTYQRALHGIAAIPEMADKMLAERFLTLDNMQRIELHGFQYLEIITGDSLLKHYDPRVKRFFEGSDLSDPKVRKFLDSMDWDPILRKVNEWFDRQVVAMQEKDRTAREKIFDQIEADLKRLEKKVDAGGSLIGLMRSKDNAAIVSERLGDFLVSVSIASGRKFQHAAERGGQIQRNLDVAFALALYQRDNGRYPMKLDALAPKYLPKVPLDVFTGKSLVYRPAETGYLFYSVGPNGQDEDGRGVLDEPFGDDIRMRTPPARVEKQD